MKILPVKCVVALLSTCKWLHLLDNERTWALLHKYVLGAQLHPKYQYTIDLIECKLDYVHGQHSFDDTLMIHSVQICKFLTLEDILQYYDDFSQDKYNFNKLVGRFKGVYLRKRTPVLYRETDNTWKLRDLNCLTPFPLNASLYDMFEMQSRNNINRAYFSKGRVIIDKFSTKLVYFRALYFVIG